MPNPHFQTTPDRILGGVLIGTGFLMVLAMLHHPVVNAGTPEDAVREIIHEAGINRMVHGGATLIMVLQFYGFWVMRDRADRNEGPHLSVLLFGAGATALVGAALISGFAVPLLASYFEGDSPDGFRGLTRLAFAGNQALAGFGALALAAAGLISAWPLWRKGGWLRPVAVIGGLTGVITLLLVTLGDGIDVVFMTVIALGISLWSAAMGLYLLMRRVRV